jgi:hypothetical protein
MGTANIPTIISNIFNSLHRSGPEVPVVESLVTDESDLLSLSASITYLMLTCNTTFVYDNVC